MSLPGHDYGEPEKDWGMVLDPPIVLTEEEVRDFLKQLKETFDKPTEENP